MTPMTRLFFACARNFADGPRTDVSVNPQKCLVMPVADPDRALRLSHSRSTLQASSLNCGLIFLAMVSGWVRLQGRRILS
jgi:hypothetical protein